MSPVRRKIYLSYSNESEVAKSLALSVAGDHVPTVHSDQLRVALNKCDTYVCLLNMLFAHNQHCIEELRYVEALDPNKVCIVLLDPAYVLGGLVLEEAVKTALGKHNFFVYRDTITINEMILGTIPRMSFPRDARKLSTTVVSCTSQAIPFVHSLLQQVSTESSALSSTFSVWTEAKSGKEYCRWVRNAYQSAVSVFVVACESYLTQPRCVKEFSSFAHLPRTVVVLSDSVFDQATRVKSELCATLLEQNDREKSCFVWKGDSRPIAQRLEWILMKR